MLQSRCFDSFFWLREMLAQESIREEIIRDIEPVISAMGFRLVEMKYHRIKDGAFLTICVYGQNGVGVRECALISKNILPRLEILEELHNLHLEVSSPGIDRRIRYFREYEIFQGRGIRVLLKDSEEWIAGIIKKSDQETVTIMNGGNDKKIRFVEIRKAKLDYSQEAGN